MARNVAFHEKTWTSQTSPRSFCRNQRDSGNLDLMVDWLRRAMPPSGGLFYHYLAMRFSRTLWTRFRTDVANWLAEWSPPSTELVVFGSSAGYSLPDGFLERFERVVIVEPDPLARVLLRRRFPLAQLEFASDRSLLAPDSETEFKALKSRERRALAKLNRFLSRYPKAAVLFSNVLGQLPLEFPHLDDELFASHLIAIRSAVRDRPWASYHDLLSTWIRPIRLEPFILPGGPLDLEAFAHEHLLPAHETSIKGTARVARKLEVTDHQTHALAAGEATLCTWWELAPGRYHLIGFLGSRGPQSPKSRSPGSERTKLQ